MWVGRRRRVRGWMKYCYQQWPNASAEATLYKPIIYGLGTRVWRLYYVLVFYEMVVPRRVLCGNNHSGQKIRLKLRRKLGRVFFKKKKNHFRRYLISILTPSYPPYQYNMAAYNISCMLILTIHLPNRNVSFDNNITLRLQDIIMSINWHGMFFDVMTSYDSNRRPFYTAEQPVVTNFDRLKWWLRLCFITCRIVRKP